MVKPGRGSRLYLLTGLVFGFILAYIASCTVMPLEYYDINPASLHRDLKKDYFVLIAEAFVSNEDIGRAMARINALLHEPDIGDLRLMQYEIETDERYAASSESVRSLVNHLDVYLQTVGGQPPASVRPENTESPPELPAPLEPANQDPFSPQGTPDGG
mgnify:CR=1 FL=1